jgi:hypothetical protein
MALPSPEHIAALLKPAFDELDQPLTYPTPEDCLVVPVLRVNAEIRPGSEPGLFNIRIGDNTVAMNLDARRIARFVLRARISSLADYAKNEWNECDNSEEGEP